MAKDNLTPAEVDRLIEMTIDAILANNTFQTKIMLRKIFDLSKTQQNKALRKIFQFFLNKKNTFELRLTALNKEKLELPFGYLPYYINRSDLRVTFFERLIETFQDLYKKYNVIPKKAYTLPSISIQMLTISSEKWDFLLSNEIIKLGAGFKVVEYPKHVSYQVNLASDIINELVYHYRNSNRPNTRYKPNLLSKICEVFDIDHNKKIDFNYRRYHEVYNILQNIRLFNQKTKRIPVKKEFIKIIIRETSDCFASDIEQFPKSSRTYIKQHTLQDYKLLLEKFGVPVQYSESSQKNIADMLYNLGSEIIVEISPEFGEITPEPEKDEKPELAFNPDNFSISAKKTILE